MPTIVGHEGFTAVSATFESIGMVVAFLDDNMRVVDASPAMRGLLATPELEGRLVTDFLHADALIECLRSGRRCEGDVHTRDGRVMRACGGVLIDRSFSPDARYVVSLELADNVAAGTPSEEAERIIRALEAHRWRRSAAARSLGISRATLWRRMREFGIL